ncbi:hypothetical protein RFI_31143 [Reticulomyxa filosa]|uniref:Uncharacterized protein n=1 Tax=Reticulomyxa filosa TaxID=46433 RepID=X6LWD7_RETFI|nr:hypothetical protein RFI_31143 [Reticulomyxa filosa]|eukprot:ETO06253.1 hypothetical protein RFI_31143 [Reticulomyxa filosa]
MRKKEKKVKKRLKKCKREKKDMKKKRNKKKKKRKKKKLKKNNKCAVLVEFGEMIFILDARKFATRMLGQISQIAPQWKLQMSLAMFGNCDAICSLNSWQDSISSIADNGAAKYGRKL